MLKKHGRQWQFCKCDFTDAMLNTRKLAPNVSKMFPLCFFKDGRHPDLKPVENVPRPEGVVLVISNMMSYYDMK